VVIDSKTLSSADYPQNPKTTRISRFFSQGNFVVVVVAMIILSTIRSGIRLGANLDVYRSDSLAFPNIPFFYKSSLIMPITTQLFGLDNSIRWIAFYSLVTLLTLAITATFVFRLRTTNNARMLFALIVFSQLHVIMLTELGKFDLFLILGSIVLIFGRTFPFQLLGALSITMGNFEQSIVVLGALLLFSLSTDNDLKFRRLASIGTIAVISQYLFLDLAYGSWSADGGDSRLNWFTANWFRFLKANVASLPTLIYSGYGACWVIIAIYISKGSTTRNRFIHFTCLIFIPLAITLTTFDGTRIWVLISAPLLLVALQSFTSLKSPLFPKFQPSVLFVVFIGLLTPALIVEVEGKIKIPYLHLWNMLSN